MNMITSRTWFCSAYITKSNLSYANFAKVVLEKCELWENRWHGAQVLGASFSGSDLSGGEFSGFDWRAADVTQCDLSNANWASWICAPPICRALKWTVTRPLNCWSGWGSQSSAEELPDAQADDQRRRRDRSRLYCVGRRWRSARAIAPAPPGHTTGCDYRDLQQHGGEGGHGDMGRRRRRNTAA